VHLGTQFGVFLNFQSRIVFVSFYSMQKPDRISQPGEAVTLHVSRPYARQEGLIAQYVTKKDLRFCIGMTAWMAPPLLLLVVWAIF
jgi:hypothetical protein